MTTSQMFETAMLLLFSAGWCASIATMVATHAPVRKSWLFVGLILAGYLMGMCAKIAAWQSTGLLSPVIWSYGGNAALILLDTTLVIALTRPRRDIRDVLPVAPAPSRAWRIVPKGPVS